MLEPQQLAMLANRFCREEEGPTATEYAIMLAMLILVCVAAIGGIGSRVINLYSAIDTAIPNAGG